VKDKTFSVRPKDFDKKYKSLLNELAEK